MIKECFECAHAVVCKYRNQYADFDKKLYAFMNSSKLTEADKSIFIVESKCKKFEPKAVINADNLLSASFTQLPEAMLLGLSLGSRLESPCDTCLKKPKKFMVGDCACDWCEYNPYKPSCK